jgi:sulfur-oxidizing protein SoxZ
MEKNMSNNFLLRVIKEKNGDQTYKSIITHPMETGLRRDNKTMAFIPADYIEDVRITVDGKLFFEITLGGNVSQNPFIAFTFSEPIIDEQVMRISWFDNLKRETSYQCIVKFDKSGIFAYKGSQEDVREAKEQSGMVVSPDVVPVCDLKPAKVMH